MDIKSMLVKLAEDQAEKMQDEALKHLSSDEFTEMLATKINEKVDNVNSSRFVKFCVSRVSRTRRVFL